MPADDFSASYVQARERLRELAWDLGWRTATHVHPVLLAGDGSPLTVDVASCGSPLADRVLLTVSGTHGVEGLAGSAAQLAGMRAVGRESPPGTRVVMVHAINPWGFDRLARTNENNVDLNRNFIAWSGPPPGNEDYRAVHEALGLPAGGGPLPEGFDRARFYDAITRGQYTHAQGLMYGGSGPAWSNVVLERIVRERAAGAAHVACIDWHSGLGEWGRPYFLCFSAPDTPARDRAVRWWGRDRIERASAFGGAPTPRYQGLLLQAVERWSAPAAFTGAAVEFGSWPYDRMLQAMQADLRLRLARPADAVECRRLQAQVVEAFAPADPGWRRSVVGAAVEVQGQALQGLAGEAA
jgi:hypothetical protein